VEAQTAEAATQPQAAVTGPMTLHYFEGRVALTQFRQLGTEYGRYRPITLYLCGSTWTNSPTCLTGRRITARPASDPDKLVLLKL